MALSWWAGQGQRSHRETSSTLQQNALHVDIVAQDTCYDRTFLAESPRSSRKAQVRDLRRGPHRRERFNDLIPRQMVGERRARHSNRAGAARRARLPPLQPETLGHLCAGFARCMYSRPPPCQRARARAREPRRDPQSCARPCSRWDAPAVGAASYRCCAT